MLATRGAARRARTALHSVVALIHFTLLSNAAPALAGEPADPTEEAEDAKAPGAALPFEFGMAIGYGHGLEVRERQQDRDVADVRMLVLAPHIRWQLGQPGSGDRWYHGDVLGLIEGQLLVNFAPQTGVGGGVVGILRYQALRGRRLRPYGEIGLGLGGLGFGLESQDDGFTFLLHGGVGLRYALSNGRALTCALRWHHISNAQTHLPNNGIDDIMILLGVEF
jgi:hypothetical protein